MMETLGQDESQEIALMLPRGLPYAERLVAGVVQYVRDHDRAWTFLSTPESDTFSLLDLEGWEGAGALVALGSRFEAREAARLSLPAVNVSGLLAHSPIPRVTLDHNQIGITAAAHFLERGFRRFAYYGIDQTHFSKKREEGFGAALRSRGLDMQVLLAPPSSGQAARSLAEQQHVLEEWLVGLVKPVALLAATDYRARTLLNACLKQHLRIPHDVASSASMMTASSASTVFPASVV